MDTIQFEKREDFRKWLSENTNRHEGIWLTFSKSKTIKTVTAPEALEEALCFGWIDGQMKSLDDQLYLKYFAPRRKGSNWSAKNKGIVEALIKKGLMTAYGQAKIDEAKQSGMWDAVETEQMSETHIFGLMELIKEVEPAYTNFMAMSFSVKKTYAGLYFDAKTEAGKQRRLERIIDRLNKNLKPM